MTNYLPVVATTRVAIVAALFVCVSIPAVSQQPDEVTLQKTRDLYDAPFTHGLTMFDCEVKFDWKQHFMAAVGSLPPAAEPTVQRLQTIPHRVLVDRSGATVSAIPKEPDLSAIAHAVDLEQALKSMVKGGLDAWLPFATNVILPMGSTKYHFEKIDQGYKLTLNGPGVAATLLLNSQLKLTSGVAQQPQPMRFETSFDEGPNGYLLSSLGTGSTNNPGTGGSEASFAYSYQAVQGVQLPATVIVTPSTGEVWHYTLTDCRPSKSIPLKTLPTSPNR